MVQPRTRSIAVDNPNEAFIRVDFPSVEMAKAFRDRLLASGALEGGGMRIKTGPAVAEIDKQTTYKSKHSGEDRPTRQRGVSS